MSLLARNNFFVGFNFFPQNRAFLFSDNSRASQITRDKRDETATSF
jgi:hypothetical protein